jgi:hypothetical protein
MAMENRCRAHLSHCHRPATQRRREQLTVVTGYKRSSRDAYVQRLRERGYVGHEGDRIVATRDGIVALGPDYEPLPTGTVLREHVLERLPEGERRILEFRGARAGRQPRGNVRRTSCTTCRNRRLQAASFSDAADDPVPTLPGPM